MDMKAVGTFYYENFVSKELVNTVVDINNAILYLQIPSILVTIFVQT